MNRIFKIGAIIAAVALTSGCLQRVSTGEVGVRINASKEVQGTELMPGSWNQTLVGSVLTFPTKDISVTLDNKTPMSAENSALSDFDLTVVYGINPTSVAELYSTKSRSFHGVENDGDILLMAKYMETLVNNASYKVVRKYKSLEVSDKRAEIEVEIRQAVMDQLKEEKLDTALSLTVVQVRSILPNKDILESATAFVKSQNELKIKENEVAIAKKEAERIAALNANSGAIAYMDAQSRQMIAEGIKNGRVSTVNFFNGNALPTVNVGK